jgi:hypothetical protein
VLRTLVRVSCDCWVCFILQGVPRFDMKLEAGQATFLTCSIFWRPRTAGALRARTSLDNRTSQEAWLAPGYDEKSLMSLNGVSESLKSGR